MHTTYYKSEALTNEPNHPFNFSVITRSIILVKCLPLGRICSYMNESDVCLNQKCCALLLLSSQGSTKQVKYVNHGFTSHPLPSLLLSVLSLL